MNLINKFAQDESGATAIEYGLIAALVSVTIIAALGPLSEALNGVFGDITAELEGVGTATPET